MNSSTSITVQWGEVPCIHQNGEITGYSVRYGEEGSSEEEISEPGDSSGRMEMISGLSKQTVYTIQVAAVNSGVYSDPLTIETPDGELIVSVLMKPSWSKILSSFSLATCFFSCNINLLNSFVTSSQMSLSV